MRGRCEQGGDFASRRKGVIPGFRITMGTTLLWLSLIVLIPLSCSSLDRGAYFRPVHRYRQQPPRAARFRAFFRFVVRGGTCQSRLRLPRGLGVGALPLSGPPTARCHRRHPVCIADRGRRHRADDALRRVRWIGGLLAPLGIRVAFTPLGIFVALVFIGLPFVVRTVQPVLEDLDGELEEAAASLGAGRWMTVRRVVLPSIVPALLTGFSLALARAVGEYGSVIFIAGNCRITRKSRRCSSSSGCRNFATPMLRRSRSSCWCFRFCSCS